MPEVTAATRSEILSELDSARNEFVATRDRTEATNGSMGFDLADTTIVNCRVAIETLSDRDQIVEMLKRAYEHLPLLADGPARPALEHMRTTLVDLWKRLDPEA